ncbi:IS4 family transposase [Sorangium sp. So ce362]|uniref:IS4 family transposase n=1 Tax=Sorangium sp. So ce362 TaxID=3133303 RepID=UPI003F5E7E1E
MGSPAAEHAAALAEEMSEAHFGDARLSKRQSKLVQKLAQAPDKSFPSLLSDSELEAAYRFFGNDAVTPAAILAPHVRATLARMEAEPVVLAIHDTPTVSFRSDGQRQGLGRLRSSGQTFFAHFTLAVSGDGTRRPLGVLDLSTHVRDDRTTGNEHDRWGEQVERVAALGCAPQPLVHVMDREGDDYGLFAQLLSAGHRFVIRLAHNRLVEATASGEEAKLEQALAHVRAVAVREVELSLRPAGNRSPQQKRLHPSRAGRLAKLALGSTRVTLRRPRSQPRELPATLSLQVVRVWELEPPPGEAPVEWVLLTSEPVESDEQLAQLVDWYRARWMVEEFFKALKTGCAYEKRQIEDLHGLRNVLALFAPIAWQLLLLRSEARRALEQPASAVLTPTQLDVLRVFARKPLPENATARDAFLAIAALGGHLRRNGEPGWQTLGRGYEQLLILVQGWSAAKKEGEI